jgi:hypothetical protein
MRSKTCRPNPTTVLDTMSIKIPNPVSFFTTIQYTPSAIKATFTHRFAKVSSSISACPVVCFADITPSTTPAARGRRTNSLQPRVTDRKLVVLSIPVFVNGDYLLRQSLFTSNLPNISEVALPFYPLEIRVRDRLLRDKIPWLISAAARPHHDFSRNIQLVVFRGYNQDAAPGQPIWSSAVSLRASILVFLRRKVVRKLPEADALWGATQEGCPSSLTSQVEVLMFCPRGGWAWDSLYRFSCNPQSPVRASCAASSNCPK